MSIVFIILMQFFMRHFTMAAPKGQRRVLGHLKKLNDPGYTAAKFTQSVLDFFGCEGHCKDVYVQLEKNGRLLVSDAPREKQQRPVKMTRPSFCPIHHMTADDIRNLPPEIAGRGVDCGAATLVESGDGKLLLSRRAHHLRTFPGVWVPPGGHIEFGETLEDAGLRELREETGLTVTADMMVGGQASVLALWESVFPPKLSLGPPKRHHIVVYLHAKLHAVHTAQELAKSIKLDPEEVGACAWLDRSVIQKIVAASEEKAEGSAGKVQLPDTFSATVISREHPAHSEELKMKVLLNTAPATGDDQERVSTGTKFALAEWLKRTETGSV